MAQVQLFRNSATNLYSEGSYAREPVLAFEAEMETFSFTGVIVNEGTNYGALCVELDVASQGRTASEAKKKLLEAVGLYVESAIEGNLPLIRPVPPHDDPRQAAPETVAEVFDFKVDVAVRAHA